MRRWVSFWGGHAGARKTYDDEVYVHGDNGVGLGLDVYTDETGEVHFCGGEQVGQDSDIGDDVDGSYTGTQ